MDDKLKKALSKLLEDRRKEKELEDEARKAKNEEDRRNIFDAVGKDIGSIIGPYIDAMREQGQMTSQMIGEEMKRIIAESIKIDAPSVDTSGIESIIQSAFAGLKFPTPQVSVNVPEVKVPEMKMPESMNVSGEVSIKDVSKAKPFPVIMMGIDGKPMSFSQAISGGGGKADFFTIKGFEQSAYAELMNADGRIKVSVETGGSGLTDSELRATAVPVSQVSGANWSVSVSDVFGSTGTNVVNPDGRLKVELPTGSSGLTDTELRATAVPVTQVSGSMWSTQANLHGLTSSGSWEQIRAGSGVEAGALRVVQATDSSSSVSATQSGTWNIGTVTTVTGVTNTLATNLIDSSGVAYSGSNPVPITWVSGAGVTTATNIIDSTGIAYSGSNPLPITVVSGATSTVNSVLTRQANPTAVVSDYVPMGADDLGRQLVRPIQIRDLIKTAYVTTSTGIETTFITATAGTFLDCIMLTATNASTASVTVDIRAVTAGNIIHTMVLPASTGPIGWSPTIPWPQDETGNSWTVDVQGSDVSGTNVYFSGLFSQEI